MTGCRPKNHIISVSDLTFLNNSSGSLFYNAAEGAYNGQNFGGGSEIFKGLDGKTFQFRTLIAGSGINVNQSSDAIEIESTGEAGSIFVVADIAARDALIPSLLSGQFVFVQNTGNGSNEYGLYMWDSTLPGFKIIATQDSANVDANTLTFMLNYNSASQSILGSISAGHKAVSIMVNVLTPFNGSAPILTIGDATNGPATIMNDQENDLTQTGQYTSHSTVVYSGATETQIRAYYTSTGSTVGQARITISYV